MLVWLGYDIQRKPATEGLCIPIVKGTADAIQNPFCKALALEVNHSDWICKGGEHSDRKSGVSLARGLAGCPWRFHSREEGSQNRRGFSSGIGIPGLRNYPRGL
jgi:hypothetical protein